MAGNIKALFPFFPSPSIHSNPALEGEHWPLYTRENPIYFIFNAEGEDDLRGEKYGRGPMATSCAFWNDFLPRLRAWSGRLR